MTLNPPLMNKCSECPFMNLNPPRLSSIIMKFWLRSFSPHPCLDACSRGPKQALAPRVQRYILSLLTEPLFMYSYISVSVFDISNSAIGTDICVEWCMPFDTKPTIYCFSFNSDVDSTNHTFCKQWRPSNTHQLQKSEPTVLSHLVRSLICVTSFLLSRILLGMLNK